MPWNDGMESGDSKPDRALSVEDEAIAEQYRKMLTMGMPEGAVTHKMTNHGISQHIIDAVFPPEVPESKPTQDDPKPAATLTDEDEEIASKYRKMLIMGLPEGAVAQKMATDEVSQYIQNAVLTPASPDPVKPATTRTQEESATIHTSSGAATLTDAEQDMVTKYKKMIAMGMPEGGVIQKMSAEDVPKKVQDAVLQAPGEFNDEAAKDDAALAMSVEDVPKIAQDAVLAKSDNPNGEDAKGEASPDTIVFANGEQEIVTKYKKMIAMGMPEGAVVQKMNVEEVPKHVQDAVLAPEPHDVTMEDESKTLNTESMNETPLVTTNNANQDDEKKGEAEFDYYSDESFDDDAEEFEEFVDDDEESVNEQELFDQQVSNVLAESSSSRKNFGYESKTLVVEEGVEVTEEVVYPLPDAENEVASEASFEKEIHPEPAATPLEHFEDEPNAGTQDAPTAPVITRNESRVTPEVKQEDAVVQHPDEEMGTKSTPVPPQKEMRETPPTTTASTQRAKRNPNIHPDRTFHRLVFLAYVMMIGGAVAVCLVFMLDDETNNETLPSGTRTTSMDSVNLGSCNFSGSSMPHVIDQCRCDGELTIIPDDVEARYQRHLEEFIPFIYENYDEPISSCTDRNQALVWLSTANDFQFSEATRSERFALATLFVATKGETWTQTKNWLSESSMCDWFGVTCTNGRVDSITLTANNVMGTIPAEILILEHLSLLSLSRNKIIGEIPQEIFFLPKLTSIFLNENELSGVIPPSIQQATLLEDLDLQANNLEGTIPDDIDQATTLVSMNLSNNKLQGPLPSSLFNLPNLIELQLHVNQLDGSIPSRLSTASSLKVLDLSSNFLIGSVPTTIGDLTSLERLVLKDLNIAGSLPNVFERLSSMLELIISDTGIDGSIPKSLGRMSNIQILDLSTNRLRGILSSDIGNLKMLNVLNLSNNFLSGSIPTVMGNLSMLLELRLNDNALTGNIPTMLGRLGDLETMQLDGNLFEGSMPSRVCDLRDVNLNELVVDCTPVDCDVPECCTSCRR